MSAFSAIAAVFETPELRHMIGMPKQNPPQAAMSELVELLAVRRGFSVSQLRLAKKARGPIGRARQEAMALCYAAGKSNAQVSGFFGCADHTTVIHARQVVAARRAARSLPASASSSRVN